MQLLNGLAGLLLVAGVDNSLGAGRKTLAALSIGVIAGVIIDLLDVGDLGILIGELLNTGVGHLDS